MNVILIGERANASPWKPACWPTINDEYWEAMLEAGAFHGERSSKRLRQVGLGDVAMLNLMPPDDGRWDRRKAEEVARDWYPRLGEYDLVVLAGKRVSEAFRVPYLPGSTFDSELDNPRFLVIPHPSGRCRFWNDLEAVLYVRDRVKELMDA